MVNEEIVDKTRSLLTGTESKAEKRQRAAKGKIERDVGQNSEKDDRTKRERETKKKKAHSLPAGLDETHACDLIPMAYRVSMPTAIFRTSFPPALLLFFISLISPIQPPPL